MDPILAFWKQIDPFFHFRQAHYIKNLKEESIKLGIKEGDSDIIEIFSCDDQSKFKLSWMRFTRFHTAETLFTLILSSNSGKSVPEYSHSEMNKLHGHISEISKRHSPTHNPKGLSFSDWLSIQLTGESKPFVDQNIEDFIVQEAKIFDFKNAYNAFKHGLSIGNLPPLLQVQKASGEYSEILPQKNPVSWLTVHNSKKEKYTEYGAMDCDIEEDMQIILSSCLIIDTMKKLRVSSPGEKLTFYFPEDASKLNKSINNLIIRVKDN